MNDDNRERRFGAARFSMSGDNLLKRTPQFRNVTTSKVVRIGTKHQWCCSKPIAGTPSIVGYREWKNLALRASTGSCQGEMNHVQVYHCKRLAVVVRYWNRGAVSHTGLNDKDDIPVISSNKYKKVLPEPPALASPMTVEQHKAALEARWRAEWIEDERRAAISREMILREIHRDQEAKRQAMIERNKPRPVSVFTAPTVLIGGP